MKKNYFSSIILGIICLTIYLGQSQNTLINEYFSESTENMPFDAVPTITTYLNDVKIQNSSTATQDKVVIVGTFQSALNCGYDWDPACNFTELSFNSSTGLYTGTFLIPEGSNRYKVTVGGSWEVNYGEKGLFNGADIFLCVTTGPEEITFTYDPSTNIVITSPVTSGFSPDCLPMVVLTGSFQDELGCYSDWAPDCPNTALTFNPSTGLFEGGYNIPAGCYDYVVVLDNNWHNYFGQEGIHQGPTYSIFIPANSGITHFTYDPESHIVSSTSYGEVPQEVTKVALIGTFQDELGCDYENDYYCDKVELFFNSDSGYWEADFNLPSGCYTYWVKETFGCRDIIYGENGMEWGNYIQLYVPSEGEISFRYDPQTHIITTTSNNAEVTTVSLIGTLQDELGCNYDYESECDIPALIFNPDSGTWVGTFNLPAGCYSYRVIETTGCQVKFYGENGNEWGDEIWLYLPTESEITFSYDPQTHIISSTPYSGAPQEATNVSLLGTFQNELGCNYEYDYECDNPVLTFNPASNLWEGSFTLPAGCYSYRVKERSVCNVTIFGDNGYEWGNDIQLYVPSESEITFLYDAETNTMSSSPFYGGPQEVTKVSLLGDLQDELGCAYDYQFECNTPALVYNSESGLWEGSFTLPAGCYTYQVKETFSCNIVSYYGENGVEWGTGNQLYVPSEGEITFSYDPETNIISTTPYYIIPQEVTKVSLFGTLQDEFGCAYDYNWECDYPALQYNPASGEWEGIFKLPEGCYTFWVQETFGCNNVTLYGENGIEWGPIYQLYVPKNGEITFRYDPQTHTLNPTPNFDLSTVNQCPGDYYVNNSAGLCGAIVNYPEFVETGNCGGEIVFITQTEGLPSGSLFPVGSTTNTFILYTTTGDQITCSFDVNVIDIESPVISGLNQSHQTLWPPNHKMVPVFIGYSVTDNCNIASTEIFISSNEPVNGPGDGNTAPDWEILDKHNILLRAERSGKGNGREYYITIKVTDDSGNTSEQLVTVTVPHDKGSKNGEVNNSDPSNDKYVLYPNGVVDVINIKGPKSTSNSAYVIFNMLGVMQKHGTIYNDQIEVTRLPQGIYILKFEIENGYIFKQFIKN